MHYDHSSDTVFRAVPLQEAHERCLHHTAEHSTKALLAALPAQESSSARPSAVLFGPTALGSVSTSGSVLASEPLSAVTQVVLSGLCSDSFWVFRSVTPFCNIITTVIHVQDSKNL